MLISKYEFHRVHPWISQRYGGSLSGVRGTVVNFAFLTTILLPLFRFTVNFAEIFMPNDPKVPRVLFLERFPKVYQTNLHELR